MDWEKAAHRGTHEAIGFRFGDGTTLDLRLAYRTLGTLSPNADNAVLLLHGTVGSGLQYLKPGFANALFGPGEPLDAERFFIVLPDAIGHGGSSKPSDGLEASFPRYGYGDIVEAQHLIVTGALGLRRLRLVMGASMGGMQTWMWGVSYPDMMDALMPVASLPERVSGRNLLWRRLLVEVARAGTTATHGSVTGLGLAWVLFQMMGGSPNTFAASIKTPEDADAYLSGVAHDAAARENLNDVVWEFEASRDYDPSGELHRITAPLLALNFADDEINPVQMGGLESAIRNVARGRAVTLPVGPGSLGHQTLSEPALWKRHVQDLLENGGPPHGRTDQGASR